MSNLSMSSRSSNSFPISDCFIGAGATLMGSGARKATRGLATLLTSRMYSPAVEIKLHIYEKLHNVGLSDMFSSLAPTLC